MIHKIFFYYSIIYGQKIFPNFSNIFLSPAIGVFINKYFFGVNKTDLTHYPDLIFTALIGSML